MSKLLSLPLVALLAIGTPVLAQETTEAEPETSADTAAETTAETAGESTDDSAEAPAIDGQLEMGRPVDEDPTYVKDTYGDWQLKCFRSEVEGQEELCQMYQLLTEDAGNPVAEFSMFRLPDAAQAAAGATIVVPLGTLLSKELKISIDGGKAKSYPYAFCSMVGCFARIGFTAADVAAFKRGVTAVVQIVPAQAPDQTVDIKASLNGFTAAFDNVSTIQN